MYDVFLHPYTTPIEFLFVALDISDFIDQAVSGTRRYAVELRFINSPRHYVNVLGTEMDDPKAAIVLC